MNIRLKELLLCAFLTGLQQPQVKVLYKRFQIKFIVKTIFFFKEFRQ